ncbi:hypothetical protein BJV74DRAFT_820739 [Russula compacta]|nr:hypothetical protein BJV74DRAFT_820739 [Russula compacta]
MGSWATYTTVRYFVAYAAYPDSARRSAALSLGICSLLSLVFVAALALSFVLPYHITQSRPHLRSLSQSPHHALQVFASFFLFAPTVVNLVLVLVWRHAGSSLGLRGRCHWNLDVVWVGVGGQCVHHPPAFGVWLTAASVRLALTAIVLVAYHFASRSYHASRWPPSYRPEDIRGMDSVEISQLAHGDAPSRPLPALHPGLVHKGGGFPSIPQRSLSSSRMAVIPEFNDGQNRQRYEQEHDSAESSTLSEEDLNARSTESGTTLPKSLRRSKSSRDLQPGEGLSRHAALPSNAGEGDTQAFANQFRALVDRVSRELEESRSVESNAELPAPPVHHVPSEEPIAVLGGVIRRMPTIESVGSRELASLRSTTLVSGAGGIGSPSAVPSSSASSRPPTRATMASLNDAASASLASASQPSSRSNSLHRLRTPSELGELVRDALRARGQSSRPLPPSSVSVRPGSGGSISGSGESASAASASRSRSNSLGLNEVLAPVTEHGELAAREHATLPQQLPPPLPLRAPARRLLGGVDTSEQQQLLIAGAGTAFGAGEMGELVRAEWTRSWTSSSPSATSTAYFSAGTSGSGSAVGGSDTGNGGHGSHGGLR